MSTYLGLAITRGLRWLEIVSGLGLMVVLMVSAEFVARETVNLVVIGVLEGGLLAFAVLLRFVARHRWTRIDWMMCRRDRTLVGRGA